jgi:hypothetical protein
LPTSGRTTPVTPSGNTCAETPLWPSVISRTWAVPDVTLVVFPISPPAAITGWSMRSPSLDPLSIVRLEYQTVDERAITRAVTGAVDCGK